MRRLRAPAIGLVLVLSACLTHSDSPRPSTSPTTLRERLNALARVVPNIPQVSPTTSCPITRGHDLETHAFGGFALGSGPAFPIIAENRDANGIYHFGSVQPTDDGWWPLKTLWALSPTVEPPFLVRVARLDGDRGVGVEGGSPAGSSIATGIGTGPFDLYSAEIFNESINVDDVDHWPSYPGGTFVKQQGCYAFQVDGRGFSYTLVFRADK